MSATSSSTEAAVLPLLARHAILIALAVAGCGVEPDLPQLVGEADGIEYHASPDLDITLDGMVEQVTLAAKELGVPLSRFAGLKIAYSSSPFPCGEVKAGDAFGCYTRGQDTSIQLWSLYRCAYIVPVTHEMWHHISHRGEPDSHEEHTIMVAQQHVNQTMILKYCPHSVFPE